nr:HNH endonuclease [Komagataeibacter sp. FXV3]
MEEVEAPEGRILTVLHHSRERSRKIVQAKKKDVLAKTGRLACEACGFDFVERYGDRGQGFIECHHIKPLSDLPNETKTRLDDLALVCANCHRMIHAQRPWMNIEELSNLVYSVQNSI